MSLSLFECHLFYVPFLKPSGSDFGRTAAGKAPKPALQPAWGRPEGRFWRVPGGSLAKIRPESSISGPEALMCSIWQPLQCPTRPSCRTVRPSRSRADGRGRTLAAPARAGTCSRTLAWMTPDADMQAELIRFGRRGRADRLYTGPGKVGRALAGYLNAVWPDFWGCVFEVWPARKQYCVT